MVHPVTIGFEFFDGNNLSGSRSAEGVARSAFAVVSRLALRGQILIDGIRIPGSREVQEPLIHSFQAIYVKRISGGAGSECSAENGFDQSRIQSVRVSQESFVRSFIPDRHYIRAS